MRDVLVVGAGNIGEMVAALLSEAGHTVTLADRDGVAMAKASRLSGVTAVDLAIEDDQALERALAGKFAVISAAPYHLTGRIAQHAHAAGVHYLDLTEDVANTRKVKELAATARATLIPQCGLAPGFISIIGADLAGRFDELESLKLRVGALPQFPTNRLSYNLTWSTEGVINEYIEPCEAIVASHPVAVPALEEVEHFSLNGVRYEAFNTSGGLGTLCETLTGRVRTLNYRTVRYPGHRDAMKLLLEDLGLRDDRVTLRKVLERALPTTDQDVVIIFATATGLREGRLVQESYANQILAGPIGSRTWTAIQITTASAVCAVFDLLDQGRLPARGFVRQEDISLELFLSTRFGAIYAPSAPPSGATA
jgi:saccharopine dehydrogenase-like NADP-dependent oxidoreductase